MLGIGPFPERGLDEAFGFSIGSRSVGPRASMPELLLLTRAAELVGAVRASVIGQQSAHMDVAFGEEGTGLFEEADGIRRPS